MPVVDSSIRLEEQRGRQFPAKELYAVFPRELQLKLLGGDDFELQSLRPFAARRSTSVPGSPCPICKSSVRRIVASVESAARAHTFAKIILSFARKEGSGHWRAGPLSIFVPMGKSQSRPGRAANHSSSLRLSSMHFLHELKPRSHSYSWQSSHSSHSSTIPASALSYSIRVPNGKPQGALPPSIPSRACCYVFLGVYGRQHQVARRNCRISPLRSDADFALIIRGLTKASNWYEWDG